MKIKAIVYDFDGVICDSVNEKTKAFASLYSRYGADIEQKVIKYHLLNGGISRFEKIKYYEENILNRKVTQNEINNLANNFSNLVKNKVIESNYIKGADLFIKKNYKLVQQYICTGTPENEMLEILIKKGIDIYFKSIFGSPKSKDQILENIIAETKLHTTEIIYFGDAITDFNAAKRLNIPFIGIKNSHTNFPIDTNIIIDFNDEKLNDIII